MKKFMTILIFVLISAVLKSQNFTLKGKIIDKIDGKAVNNANVSVSLLKGDISDENGNFEIQLDYGKHRIRISHINYETYYLDIEKKDGSIHTVVVELNPKPIELKGVEVTAKKDESPEIKKIEVSRRRIDNLPSIGESDVIKSASYLPGISNVSDFSSQLYIWGGNYDKTLITIDNIPVWNPYHLGGIFSFVSSNVLDSYKLYPAAYPAHMGDVLSGVFSLSTIVPSMERYEFASTLSFVSANFVLSGPVFSLQNGLNSSFMISARRTYFDALMNIETKNFPYYFYDLIGRYDISDQNNFISITSFYSSDVLYLYDENLAKKQPNWGNFGFGLRWIKKVDDLRGFNLVFYNTQSFMKSNYNDLDINIRSQVNNKINESCIRGEYVINLSDYLKLNLGGEFKFVDIFYDWIDQGGSLWQIMASTAGENTFGKVTYDFFFDYAPSPFFYKEKLYITSVYTSGSFAYDKMDIGGSLKITNNKLKSNFYPSANINFRYEAFPSNYIKLGTGAYNQYLFIIKNRMNQYTLAPFSVYLTDNKPEKSKHYFIGLESNYYRNKFEMGAYYKFFENITNSVESAEKTYVKTKGVGYGLYMDLHLKYKFIDCNINYSLGYARKKNQEGWTPSYYEQRHNLKIMTLTRLSRKWDVSLFWTYMSGLPYTPVIGYYFSHRADNDDEFEELGVFPIFGPENSRKTPDFHRLDVKFSGKYNWGKFRMKPYIQFFNIFNNKRITGYDFTSVYTDKRNASFLIPSLGLEIYAEL